MLPDFTSSMRNVHTHDMALLGIPDVQTARKHQRTGVPLLWAQQLFCTILKDVLNIARQEFDVNKRFPFGTIKLCLEDELLMLTVMWIQLCCQI